MIPYLICDCAFRFCKMKIQFHKGGTLIAVGLSVAAAAFAGRHAFRLWKPVQQMIVETVRTIPSPSFSAYYKGGFEAKMSKREASLVLGVRRGIVTHLQMVGGQLRRITIPCCKDQ
ncbi:hypothetical protein scyTo_0014866 [Scyliorhinus torazame]|uniref:Uncharacterized protein n=1 Tax=Scyliorhinus torazame TaxID=75743 RepID=A0A401NWH2_SCYTO|nr:hypothetical protein [Scyliorhinus torazame]